MPRWMDMGAPWSAGGQQLDVGDWIAAIWPDYETPGGWCWLAASAGVAEERGSAADDTLARRAAAAAVLRLAGGTLSTDERAALEALVSAA